MSDGVRSRTLSAGFVGKGDADRTTGRAPGGLVDLDTFCNRKHFGCCDACAMLRRVVADLIWPKLSDQERALWTELFSKPRGLA